MADFDPAALLKQIRTKTPVRSLPQPPSRTPQEDPLQAKVAKLEATIESLEAQLDKALSAESQAKQEKEEFKRIIESLESKQDAMNKEFAEKIESLESQLGKERTKKTLPRPRENEGGPKPRENEEKREIPKPFVSGISNSSGRYASSKQKGQLDLTPLVELYKIMPDFPRPVLTIEFTMHK